MAVAVMMHGHASSGSFARLRTGPQHRTAKAESKRAKSPKKKAPRQRG